MPIFEFRCACGQVQSELVTSGHNVPDQLPCPCGGAAVRIVSEFAISGGNIGRSDEQIREGERSKAWMDRFKSENAAEIKSGRYEISRRAR